MPSIADNLLPTRAELDAATANTAAVLADPTVSRAEREHAAEIEQATLILYLQHPGADAERQAEAGIEEHLETDDPTPELATGLDDLIEPGEADEPFEFDAPDPVTPDEARTLFADHLEDLRTQDKTELAARDFRPIMRPGMGRAWIHARLNEYVERGHLLHDPETRTYQFPKAA